MKKKEIKSDFILAKEIVATLELHKDVIIKVLKIENFRKYLRDHSKYIDKHYVTKVVEDGIKITRLK